MIVDHNILPFTVRDHEPIEAALAKIDRNKSRLVFVVDDGGALLGTLSDGDFRRWLLRTGTADLRAPVGPIANPDPVTVRRDQLRRLDGVTFDRSVDLVPVLDDRNRIVAVARQRSRELIIDGIEVSETSPAFVIAEIGINHNGDYELARQLVEGAARAGADCAKFQMRDLASLYRNVDHPVPANEDLGAQYVMDLVSTHALPTEQMLQLFDRCRELGIVPLCTPWDEPSLDVLLEYGLGAVKVASADLTNHPFLRTIARTGTPIIMSTGMSTDSEVQASVKELRAEYSQYALLQCNSTYPAPYKDVQLRYMDRLREVGDCVVGYSGHERGHEVPLAAVAMGAKIIEKHFTLDRAMRGNDHKVSLLPDEFAAMVRSIRNIEEAIGSSDLRRVTPGELMNRVNLAKSLVAVRPLPAGTVVKRDDIAVKSPGRGLQPDHLDALVGTTLRRDVEADDFFYPADLTDEAPGPGTWSFRRPWGIPVRYHDHRSMCDQVRPDFLEFHLTYSDMELDLDDYFDEHVPTGVAVHAPDLFHGDHILDLASPDDEYRDRSVFELQRTIDLSRRIADRFDQSEPPIVIVSMGGFTSDAPADPSALAEMYERVADSISRVNEADVRMVSQTLPPFPWYLGGQLYCNLFVGPEDTAEFCRTYGRRLCLDISHTRLATNHAGVGFLDSVVTLAPYVEHLHVVDAVGTDGEGLQIGEGEIDFPALGRVLDEHCPGVGFIPEIWMGHKSGGEGFWTALRRLEGAL